jgi:hypothetical protein
LKQERLEHLQLFNLFGDPTMRLQNAQEVKISATERATAGQPITIQGECSMAGTATVSLAKPLDRVGEMPRDWYDGTESGRGQFDTTYQLVNRAAVASAQVEVKEGKFVASLPVPDDAEGKYCIRVFVQGADGFAVGGSRVQIAAAHDSGDNSAEPKVADRATDHETDPAEHRQ